VTLVIPKGGGKESTSSPVSTLPVLLLLRTTFAANQTSSKELNTARDANSCCSLQAASASIAFPGANRC